MTAIGLWNIAAQQPHRTALVTPDGREVDYAELAGEADRLGRGLQSMGLAPGDSIVLMQPNGFELVAAYFAAMQTGLYVVTVNWHLVGAEIAYILGDSGAKAFLAHERFADTAREAADLAGLDAERCFAVGEV